jgi:cytochrome P450
MEQVLDSSEFRIPDAFAQPLVDPAAYADGRIYDAYAWLRKNMPIGIAEPEGFSPFWVITRYADVREIGRNNKLFRSGDRPITLMDKASDAFQRELSGGKPYLARSLVQMDPPDHIKYRLMTQGWFAPKHLATLEARIGKLADAAVAKLDGLGGSCDFVEAIGLNYPLEIVMDIIGVPKEDLPFMLELTQEMFAPRDPDFAPEGVDVNDPAFIAAAMKATQDRIGAYFSKITEDRRRQPREDVATIVANAEIDGEPISDVDALGYYIILITAGHDTTSSSTAAAMYALASQPELFARVKADPCLIPALIQEAVRWGTPVKTFMRSLAEDAEFEGVPFRKDDWLMLCYASANRDELVLDNADRFDIDRPKFAHVAFGYGPHVCLGQNLAKLEMTMLFERLIPRLKSVSLSGEMELSQSFFVNGPKHLPIKFELE